MPASPTPAAPLPARPTTGWRAALRDPWTWVLLALALFLQLWTLGRIEGYLLADSVEYMDRAQYVARGEALDPSTIRSFAFSALLVPLFWLTDLVGAAPLVAVGLARLAVMLAGLATIVVVQRSASRAFGRGAGLAAGFTLAVNPVFLQFGVEPLSESVATLGVALACSGLLRLVPRADTPSEGAPPAWRTGLRIGAWFGFALLMAFKTIPIAAVVLAGLVLAGRWRRRALWLGAWLAYGCAALVQCLLDLAVYGRFGGSLGTYLVENVGGLVAGQLIKLHGLGVPGAYDLAVHIYENMSALETGEVAASAANVTEVIRSSTSETWYLETLAHDFLAWPLALGLALGLVASLEKRHRGVVLLIAAALLANVFLLSTKSAKSWRLMIPLLPAFALFAGLGVQSLVTGLRRRLGLVGHALSVMFVVALVGLGLGDGQAALARQNLAQYGAWWAATDDLERLAEADGADWTFASAYHWAVRFRSGDALELVKLPHHMDRWPELTEDEREETLAALDELDAFLAHLQILEQDPEILRRVNARFQIFDVRYDGATFDDLGPLYVLVRRDVPVPYPRRTTPRTFFELHKDADPGAFQAALINAHSVDYRRRQGDETWQMVLLGYEVEAGLADDQVFWLTLHWYVGNTGGRDFKVVLRMTDRDDRALEHNAQPAYGAWPTAELEAGWILSESHAFRVPLDAARFGGADWRGEALPTKLWMALSEFVEEEPAEGEAPRIPLGLNPFQPSGRAPFERRSEGPGGVSISGHRWSPDGLFQVGGFWLPVPQER